jgi:hypothetical protein
MPDTPAVRGGLADYVIEVEYTDAHIGRALQALEAAGELDNTLLIVTSDHDMPFPFVKGQIHKRYRRDYGQMMRQAIRDRKVGDVPADQVGERLEKMDPSKLESDFRVSMSWNTDATNIDLWVIEPDGTKVFYSALTSKNGGELSQGHDAGFRPGALPDEESDTGRVQGDRPLFRREPQPARWRDACERERDAIRRHGAGGDGALYRDPQEAEPGNRGLSGQVLSDGRARLCANGLVNM